MPHPSRHTAKRRLLTAAAVLLAVLLAAGAAGYGLFTGSITDRDSVVCIPENTSFEALCDTLSAEGRHHPTGTVPDSGTGDGRRPERYGRAVTSCMRE